MKQAFLSVAAVVALATVLWAGLSRPHLRIVEAPALTAAEARNTLARQGEFALVIRVGEARAELVHGAAVMREIPLRGLRGASRMVEISALAGRRGTLPFEPIQHVTAPPDTASAEPPRVRPLDSDPAYGVLVLENGREIRLSPHDTGVFGSLEVSGYRVVDHLRTSVRLVRTMGAGDPAPRPPLVLQMSDRDARAIYRALPIGARVLVTP
ncbi:MAG: hypothetical protein JJ896_01830 [Rhodothermales bacterium]|nr:hypothetical protein [Rhodothermales bacterium]MBO6778367.1 hypothetical protein [Rhodothermales bacterium]